jgi:hypothetical protein
MRAQLGVDVGCDDMLRVFKSKKQMVLSDNNPPKPNPLTGISVQPCELGHQAISSDEALGAKIPPQSKIMSSFLGIAHHEGLALGHQSGTKTKTGPRAWNEPPGADQLTPLPPSHELSTNHTRKYCLCRRACGRYSIVFLPFQAMQQQI